MNRTLLAIASLAWLIVAAAEAQPYQKTELGIKATLNSVDVEIQFYNSSTVRILKSPEGKTPAGKSLSVIATPKKTAFSIRQVGDELVLKSDSVQVDLNTKDCEISFLTSAGEPLLREHKAGAAFNDFNDAGVNTYSVSQSFVLDKDEAIYGLGQQQQGKMVQRNDTLHMIQGNTDDRRAGAGLEQGLRSVLGQLFTDAFCRQLLRHVIRVGSGRVH